MTDKELAAIKSRVVRFTPASELHTMSPQLSVMTFDARALLDEVERWRAIGRALAAYTPEHSDYSGYYGCQFCHAEREDEPDYNLTPAQWRAWLTHADDCPVTKARALLGMSAD